MYFLTFSDHLEEGCIGPPWDMMDEPFWGGKRGRNGQVFAARGRFQLLVTERLERDYQLGWRSENRGRDCE